MRRVSILVLLALNAVACRRVGPPPAEKLSSTNVANPAMSASSGAVQGTLLERIDVPNYSYLRIQSGKEEVWAAVPTATVEKGSTVAVVNAMPMKAFESKTLKRTFDVIYFGNLEGASSPGGMPSGMTVHPAPAPSTVDLGNQKIEKAAGSDARTVAEIFTQKTTLKDHTVTLRGKVVKYNATILGRNWIHLQDGSGKPSKGDHDIAVTTQDTAALGEVIQVKGTVHLDKDFGAGYSYPVIIEEARIVR